MHAHRYRIIVCGRLSQMYWEAFDGLEVKPSGGYTTLTGDLDQAALHGVLDRILALALELVEVTRLPPPDALAASTATRLGDGETSA